jgi:hypothetical protein
MHDPNTTSYAQASDCDIDTLFKNAMDMNEPPSNTFNLILQCFTQGLAEHLTTKEAICQIQQFSRHLTDYLTAIEYEITYL